MNDTQTKYRAGIMFTVTAAASALIMWFMKLAPVGVDDANILLVYSKHLAMGEGLVYNIGGERVEGFSSLLWVLLTAPGYLISESPYPYFFALNVLLVGGALTSTILFIDARSDTPADQWFLSFSLPSLLFIAWLLANPSFFIWTVTSLLETGLWAALLLLTTVRLLTVIDRGRTSQRDLYLFAGLFAAQLITRPEAFAWVLSFGALTLLTLRAQGVSGVQLVRQFGVLVAAAALTFGLLVLFRLWYFGYPLPNTYYAKVTPDKLYNLRFGIAYLLQFVQASPAIVPFILLALLGCLRNLVAALRTFFTSVAPIEPHRLGQFSLSCIVLSGVVIPVLMGGDIFGAYRFYQPLWPIAFLLLVYFPLPESWRPRDTSAVAVALFAAVLIVVTYSNSVRWPDLSKDPARVVHLYQLADRQIQTGRNLHALFDEYPQGLPSIGASGAGGIKIGYAGNVLDTMGLNFTPMAHHDGDKKGAVRGHAAFDKDVFWQYAPQLFEPKWCPPKPPLNKIEQPDGWWYPIYRGLPGDERFLKRYTFVVINVPDSDERVCTHIDKDLLADLRASGDYEISPDQ